MTYADNRRIERDDVDALLAQTSDLVLADRRRVVHIVADYEYAILELVAVAKHVSIEFTQHR